MCLSEALAPRPEGTQLPEEVHVAVPTRDATGVLQTALDLFGLGSALGRPVSYSWTAYGSIPRARNALTEHIRAQVGRDRAWVLWVDSDIFLQGGIAAVAQAIRWSWQTGCAWTAHYHRADGLSHIMAARDVDGRVARNLTDAEIEALPEWAEVGAAGLGMCFVPMPLDYVWHADRAGEDVLFWIEHPEIRLHLAKRVTLLHMKTTWV
jgi:hypothetical protein